MRKLLLGLVAALSVLTAFVGRADAPYDWATSSATVGSYELGIPVPNTRDGGNWITTINVYKPGTHIGRAYVAIPGATGNANAICWELRICSTSGPVTANGQVNWAVLAAGSTELISINTVAPLGGPDFCQASRYNASVTGNVATVSGFNVIYNPVTQGDELYLANGTDTGYAIGTQISGTTGAGGTYNLTGSGTTYTIQAMYSTHAAPTAPNTTTSCNKVETSGNDDPEFYVELSDYISNGCNGHCTAVGNVGGFASKNLVGFSNGGMMISRMWCQFNQHYAHYAVISGPQGAFFLTHSCTPANPKPYYAMYGGMDADLGICTAGQTCPSANNWTASSWTGQNATFATIGFPALAAYIPASIYLCGMANVYAGSTVCTGPAVPQFGDSGFSAVATHTAVKQGFLDQWCYGGATCPIELNYVYLGQHSPLTDQTVLGYAPFRDILQWTGAN